MREDIVGIAYSLTFLFLTTVYQGWRVRVVVQEGVEDADEGQRMANER